MSSNSEIDYGNAKHEKSVYMLKITAKNIEDIRVIKHKVKIGTIRPEESYEERQGGKTRQQLESELLQTQQQLGTAYATIEELRGEVSLVEKSFADYRSQFSGACEKNVRVRQLIDELLGKSADGIIFCWPLVSRRGVVEKITAILDDTRYFIRPVPNRPRAYTGGVFYMVQKFFALFLLFLYTAGICRECLNCLPKPGGRRLRMKQAVMRSF